jgi:hypothetical protein
MFNSAILDVAVGLIFVFLVVSLIASALTEMIASFFKLRSKTLLSGVKALLNDASGVGLVKDLYNHALINPRDDGKKATADATQQKPAYIDPAHFADALIELSNIAGIPRANTTPGAPGAPPNVNVDQIVKQMTAAIDATSFDPQIKQVLKGIVDRTSGDLDKIRTQVASWFDNAMDRVGGAYKRMTQLVTFLIAFGVAGALNIDTIQVTEALWARPLLAKGVDAKYPNVASAVTDLDKLGLPIGWSSAPAASSQGAMPRLVSVLGWLITAIATVFGAPFWYDILQTVVRIKGAGPSPQEKKTGSAAAA